MNTTPPSLTLPGRVVVFDYGEVISLEPTAAERAALLEKAGVPDAGASAFWEAYWGARSRLDAGTLPIRDYWRVVGEALGRSWDAETIHQLWVLDITGWMSVNPETLAVVERLVEGGTRTALLSNAGADYSSFFRSGSFGDLFEQHFVSGELHIVKPDGAIYRHVLDSLGITAAEMVFIDNKRENVVAAERLGVTGHVFTTAAELTVFLEGLA